MTTIKILGFRLLTTRKILYFRLSSYLGLGSWASIPKLTTSTILDFNLSMYLGIKYLGHVTTNRILDSRSSTWT